MREAARCRPGRRSSSAAEIETLKKWIAAGAKVEAPEPETLATGFTITDNDAAGGRTNRCADRPCPGSALNSVDAFLLVQLREKGLNFNSPAEKVAPPSAAPHST